MPEEEKEEAPQFHGTPHQVFMKDPYFKRWYPTWIHNGMENYQTIKKDFSKKNCCITSHPRPMNRPAIIIGSGPSLDEAAPLLKDWKHPIFSPTSALFSILRWGRKPDYACAFDSLWSLYEDFKFKKYSWEGTTLITHPNAEPKLLEAWKWNKYYFRRMFQGHEFFELTFPMMFPWIKIGFRFTGCVVNNAVSIASFLGFSPIFLVGVDFGWKDKKNTKSTTWEETKDGWVMQPNIPMSDTRKCIEYRNGTFTHPEYISFKRGLLGIINSEMETDFVNCSNGLVDELAEANIEEVIKNQGYGDYGIDKELQRQKSIEFINIESNKIIGGEDENNTI